MSAPPTTAPNGDQLTLYSYWRSSCSYRVRIALNLLQLPYKYQSVHLLKSEQSEQSYLALNPGGVVPTLVVRASGGHDTVLIQSLAIIEYVDAVYGGRRLVPTDPLTHYQCSALSHIIACDTQPPANSRHLAEVARLTGSEAAKSQWAKAVIEAGLAAYERSLANFKSTSKYSVGDSVTLADICLVPQLYNARRFGVNLDAYPRCVAIEAECEKLEAFRLAAPELQPDKQ